jgi:hypothetical protein
MNVSFAATTAAQRSRQNGFVDVNTGKIRRCHLRLGAWQTRLLHAKPPDGEFCVLSVL